MVRSFLYTSANLSSTLPCLNYRICELLKAMKSCWLQNRPLLYDIMPEDAPCKEIFYQLMTFRRCVHWADLHVLDDLRISFLLRMAHVKLVFSLKLFRNLLQLLMELLDLRRGELGEQLAKIEGERPARYVQAEPRRVCEQAYRTWEHAP